MGWTWKEICADPILAETPNRIETDEWGNIIMSPPPGMNHSVRQSRIARRLRDLLRGGDAFSEFPLRTAKGVKGIDVVWISDDRLAKQPSKEDVAVVAPEICVEVYSPRNRRAEIHGKMQLYFEEGALECWTCDLKGKMSFFNANGQMSTSKLCPDFPTEVVGLLPS